MNRIFQFLFLTTLVGCNTAPKHNATVSSTVKGLQKGTAYLQKFKDTTYITVDSLSIKGTEFFILGCELLEPEVLYLSLSNEPTAERIEFFASEGNTTINTSLKRFVYDAKIEGNIQQKLLNDYRANLTRFKNKQLELIQASLNAQRTSNNQDVISTKNEMEVNLKRQYLYSINYAVSNNDNEVAPYIALSDVYDANPKYLDTIYNSLTPRIAASKYGVILKDYIEKIKPELTN